MGCGERKLAIAELYFWTSRVGSYYEMGYLEFMDYSDVMCISLRMMVPLLVISVMKDAVDFPNINHCKGILANYTN